MRFEVYLVCDRNLRLTSLRSMEIYDFPQFSHFFLYYCWFCWKCSWEQRSVCSFFSSEIFLIGFYTLFIQFSKCHRIKSISWIIRKISTKNFSLYANFVFHSKPNSFIYFSIKQFDKVEISSTRFLLNYKFLLFKTK